MEDIFGYLIVFVPILISFAGIVFCYKTFFSTYAGAFDRKEILKKRFRKGEKYDVPVRREMLEKLDEEFDLIVIGGGATGCGVALDALTRGLKVCLVEAFDFGSQTSSKTTKLAHGGVRYLQKAIKKLDRKELIFVRDGLKERRHFFQIAPFMVKPLSIITPCYKKIKTVLKNYIELKLYDALSGSKARIGRSGWLSKKETLKMMPLMKEKGLLGSVRYYDGQFNDARMACLLASTSAALGGCILNHTVVVGLINNEKNKVKGVVVEDKIAGIKREIHGKQVINCCGYLVDGIRQMDKPDALNIISPSAGVHVVIDKKFSPEKSGILLPTSDGRVLFVLSYEGKTIVGTTEGKVGLEFNVGPTEEQIQFILKNMNTIFKKKVERKDILSSWAGVRPLVRDPNVKGTSGLSRDHYISVSENGLLTICGGKWTSFRRMAEKCVDKAVEINKDLKPKSGSNSSFTVLVGAENYKEDTIMKQLQKEELDDDTREHLIHFYGDKALRVVEIAKDYNLLKKLDESLPHIEAEVVYQVRTELASTVHDVLSNRSSIMFLDLGVAAKIAPRVADLMSAELGWDQRKTQEMIDHALEIMQQTTK